MNIKERIQALSSLGNKLKVLISSDINGGFEELLIVAENHNLWFSQMHLQIAFSNIIAMLDENALNNWIGNYKKEDLKDSAIRVGVIMAGNIPLVGFHDFLSVIISGKVFIGKLSSSDILLLPYIAKLLIDIEPRFKEKIIFEEELMKNFDAVIATGSNNSSRYFDYYFSKYPNIIRKNRNSVAILTGDESVEDIEKLGKDVFLYFGLGCRNVSKLLLPKGYDIPHLLDSFVNYEYVQMHTKYFNNYEYNKSLLLINKEVFYDNGFLLLREKTELATAVSVLNYEFYDDYQAQIRQLNMRNDDIQCIISGNNDIENTINFGESQSPTLMDYADNVDVMSFLTCLKD